MQKSEPRDLINLWTGAGAIALVVLWFLWFWGGRHFLGVAGLDGTIEKAGVMGDSFGAINTLFTGLAMIGAVGSLAYQQKTIRDQQAAQAEQQKEIADQQQQLHETHIEQLKARFEQSFFELLKLSRELRGKIAFRNSPAYKDAGRFAGTLDEKTGDKAFEAIKREVLMLWQANLEMHPPVDEEHKVGAYYAAKVHAQSEDQLGPYFRIIYSMLRRISEAWFLSEDEKIAYGNLLRSQLTSTELFVIGVNGLAHISGDLRKYLTEFRMFKYLPDADKAMFLGSWLEHGSTYETKAFEGRHKRDV